MPGYTREDLHTMAAIQRIPRELEELRLVIERLVNVAATIAELIEARH